MMTYISLLSLCATVGNYFVCELSFGLLSLLFKLSLSELRCDSCYKAFKDPLICFGLILNCLLVFAWDVPW